MQPTRAGPAPVLVQHCAASPPGSPLAGPALCWPVPATCFLSPGRQRGARRRARGRHATRLPACVAWPPRRLASSPRRRPDSLDPLALFLFLVPLLCLVLSRSTEHAHRRRSPLPQPPPSRRCPEPLPSSCASSPTPSPSHTTERAPERRPDVFPLVGYRGSPSSDSSPLVLPRARRPSHGHLRELLIILPLSVPSLARRSRLAPLARLRRRLHSSPVMLR